MKKVRIFKKDPTKILKALDNPSKSKKKNNFKPYLDREKVKSLNLKLYPSEKNQTIHSHRYKISEYQGKITNRKINSQRNSPANRQGLAISFQRQKTQTARKSSCNQDFQHFKYKSTEKSPYLLKHSQTPKKNIYIEKVKKNNSESLKHVNFRSIRLSSLDNKETKETISKEDSEILKQAKKLMHEGELRKSILILKSLIKKSPDNLEAMYAACSNWFKLGDFEKCLFLAEKIANKDKSFHLEIYLMIARCYMKLKEPENSLQKLEQGLKWFPENAELHIEKGKILAKQQEYMEAVKSFQAALNLDPENQEVGQKLLMSYFYLEQYSKVVEIASQILENSHCFWMKKCLEMKVKALFKLKRFQEIIELLGKTNELALMYYLGFSYYKANDYQNSLICLETAINTGEDNTKIIKLMLLIHIKEKNFYEAQHILERVNHLFVKGQDIIFMKQFIEGTLMLMKRNIEEGILILQNLRQKLDKMESKDESILEIKVHIHPFLAYGYFCIGEFEKCRDQYEKHKNKRLPPNIQGLPYNILLTQAILAYDQKNFKEASSLFQSAKDISENKLQPHFYLALTYITIFCDEQILEKRKKQHYLQKAAQQLIVCANLAGKLQNNIGANIFYHKCILHCFMDEWKQAIICIDEAIQRSQENYWKFFYVRALILSTFHNFIDAINDVSIAINLKNTEADPFLLRARCFQIEGEGNSAFKDLQNYILLRPKDQQIHKFAGQLLFENGAFEDAILAFNHEPIKQIPQNYDVFLTKSKTYFLLGQFENSSIDMEKSYHLKPQNQHNLFDGELIKIFDQLTKVNAKYKEIISKTNEIYGRMGSEVEKKKIFKQTQQYLIRAICYFYLQKYPQTIKEFQASVKVKQKVALKESLIEGNNREDVRDTKSFSSLIHFNVSLCLLLMGEIEQALDQLEKIKIQTENSSYSAYQKYYNLLKELSINKNIEEFVQIEVFSNRNKFSNFLPKISVNVKGMKGEAKLSIPFPKVEPPQIFPEFDPYLLSEFHIDSVEKKPEAPWIIRSENVISFTGKIQKYSRLQIEQSIDSSSVKDLQVDSSHIELRSLSSRRAQLIMDPEMEKKIMPEKKKAEKSLH